MTESELLTLTHKVTRRYISKRVIADIGTSEAECMDEVIKEATYLVRKEKGIHMHSYLQFRPEEQQALDDLLERMRPQMQEIIRTDSRKTTAREKSRNISAISAEVLLGSILDELGVCGYTISRQRYRLKVVAPLSGSKLSLTFYLQLSRISEDIKNVKEGYLCALKAVECLGKDMKLL